MRYNGGMKVRSLRRCAGEFLLAFVLFTYSDAPPRRGYDSARNRTLLRAFILQQKLFRAVGGFSGRLLPCGVGFAFAHRRGERGRSFRRGETRLLQMRIQAENSRRRRGGVCQYASALFRGALYPRRGGAGRRFARAEHSLLRRLLHRLFRSFRAQKRAFFLRRTAFPRPACRRRRNGRLLV